MAYTDDFRIYYNTSIHPELIRLESKRKRALRFFIIGALLLVGVGALHYSLGILPLTLILLTLVGFFFSYIIYRLRQFVTSFKPRIVRLILDYIDDSPNFGDLKYNPNKYIEESSFRESALFYGKFSQYIGEDFISGKIGEIDFEMSELAVRELSKVRNRLNYVFKGAFLVARLQNQLRGEIMLLPEENKQWLTRTFKKAKERGLYEVQAEDQTPEFDDEFYTLATPDTLINEILSKSMQELILEFQKRTNSKIYFCYRNRFIYTAITHQGELLEPHLFRSNISFKLIHSFYEDLKILLSIVEDFDKNH